MGNGNAFNKVNLAVLLAPFVVKTALSLDNERSPPSLTSAPPDGAGNATGPIPSTDYDDDDGDKDNKALWISLAGMFLVMIAIVGLIVFSLYRRFKNGSGTDAGWGRWWLRRAPDRSPSTYVGTEIGSPLHPGDGGMLQSSPTQLQRRGGVVVGIPISPSPGPHHHQADGDAIPIIWVSLPPHATYDNDHITSPTLLPPHSSPPPFELGGAYILSVEMPPDNKSDSSQYDVDDVAVVEDMEDEHEPCDPNRQYSTSTSATQGGPSSQGARSPSE